MPHAGSHLPDCAHYAFSSVAAAKNTLTYRCDCLLSINSMSDAEIPDTSGGAHDTRSDEI
jgi:hypothetical protein